MFRGRLSQCCSPSTGGRKGATEAQGPLNLERQALCSVAGNLFHVWQKWPSPSRGLGKQPTRSLRGVGSGDQVGGQLTA